MSTTPPPSEVAEHLRTWLTARFGGPVELDGDPSSNGEGFDSAIHFVRYCGPHLPAEWSAPLVVRIKPRPDALAVARYEATLHAWLGEHRYPVPRVLVVFAPGELLALPAQVMEQAPGAMMIDVVKRAPWTVSRRIAELADLHVRLHRLPDDGFPDADDLVDKRLRLPRHVAETFGDEGLTRALARVESLAPRLRDAPPAVCHGDFHPLNVLVAASADGDVTTVIDWSDAGLGDFHGDVARTTLLMELAGIAASSRLERAFLNRVGPLLGRRYLNAYAARRPLDPQRLALWRPAHLVHGWAQAVAARAGMFDDATLVSERLPASLVEDLQARFDRAVVAIDR